MRAGNLAVLYIAERRDDSDDHDKLGCLTNLG